jgi:hypothetical protein
MPLDSKRVESVFPAAVEADDRAAVLARECGSDAELHRRVEALLQAHDQPGSFLHPAAEGATSDDEPGRFFDPLRAVGYIPAEGPGNRLSTWPWMRRIFHDSHPPH